MPGISAVLARSKCMRRLISAFIFLQGGYLSAALRQGTDTTGSGCHVVQGAMKRKGFHWLHKCKCAAPDAVLTKSCGVEEGERKFDVTRIKLQTQTDSSTKSRRKSIADGCKCAAEPPASKASGAEARSDEDSTEAESESDLSEKENVCARWGAVPRKGMLHKKGCKCEEDWTLSVECGDQRLLRKFRSKDKDVQNSDCRCVKEEEQSRDEKLLGATEPSPKIVAVAEDPDQRSEEGSQMKEEASPTEITCKKAPPEPFKFGDIVRIEKKVHVGYRYEFAGVGIGAQYKDAGISGTIAQVVCTGDTAAVEGRVCLRKGPQGSASAGCWDVENLVKLDG